MAAGGNVLRVVVEQLVAEFEQGEHALVGDEVEHGPMLAFDGNEPAPAQAGEMVRNAGLADREPLGDLADRNLPSSRSSCRMRKRVQSARVRKYLATRPMRSGDPGNRNGAPLSADPIALA